MSKVLLLQPRCEAYRTQFYECLSAMLARRGVQLQLVYGQSNRNEAIRTASLPWATEVRNHYLYFGHRFLVWQPVLGYLRGADLIIIHQNSANLVNYPILLLRALGVLRVAFWGHGRCFQAGAKRQIREAIKRWYSRQVDYWFAYTSLSRDVVVRSGFPGDRITVVNNAVDTACLARAYDRASAAEAACVRTQLRIPEESAVALYCGRLYRDKRIEFLFETTELIRRLCPHFHLIIIGEGESESFVRERATANAEWMHFVGAKYGHDRVVYFKSAECQLMPGAVGLGIVDSFAMLTPLITTELPYHGPEIAYLQNGVNGIITSNTVSAYAEAVVRYLGDKQLEETLKNGCSEARKTYTIENMAHRFAEGVLTALDQEEAHDRTAPSAICQSDSQRHQV